MTFTEKGALRRLFLCTWMWEGRVTQEKLPRWRCDEHLKLKQKITKIIQIALTAFAIILPPGPSFASPSCSTSQFDEISTIRYIHDGDTLHLTNGRKIRLIGINTPELARDNKPAEAFSTEAKNALESLFKQNKSIALVYGKDKKDHYGRYLAHAFLTDGTNVQEAILQQGLASVITFPPNLRFAACYLATEKHARCAKAGLWNNSTVLDAKNLKKQQLGFHLIKGTVKSIKTNSKGIWLNLDNKLTVGIRPKNQSLFDLKHINNLLNHVVIVRGWLNKSNRSTPFYLRIRHPLSIQRSTTYACY